MNRAGYLGLSRTLAAMAAASIVLIAGSSYWYYRQQARDIRQTSHEQLRAIAELKSGQLSSWRQERLIDARIHANGLVRQGIARWLLPPHSSAEGSHVRDRLRLIRNEEGYQNILVASPDGRLKLSLDERVRRLDAGVQPLVSRALAERRAVLGDFFKCPDCGTIHLDVAAPVLGPGGRPLAALILRTDPERTIYPLIQSWPLPSPSAETLLVRREGGEIVFLNRLRHFPDEPLTRRQPMTNTELPAAQAVLGKTGLFDGRDYRGVQVLADLRPIPGTPWFMVAKMDADELLTEARYRGGVAVVLSGLAMLLVGVLIAFLNRLRTWRLQQDLGEARREREESQAELRATLYGIGDGVIATDREGRVTRMNPVAEQLTGWQEAEAQRRPLAEVFRIINEETRAPVASPVERVLREGLVVGLANHTLLLAKDGSERPIADSGAPVRAEDGAVAGVVLVFRDQFAERAAQKSLAEVAESYRALFANMVNGFAFCRMLYEGDRPADFLYLEVNAAFEKLTGLKSAAGKKVSELIPGLRESSPELFERYGRVARGGAPERFETYVPALTMWFDISVYRPKPEHFVAVFDVITRRKDAEKSLRDSEARFRLLAELAPEAIFIQTRGRFRYVNPAALALFGAPTAGELLDQDMYERFHPDFHAVIRQRAGGVMAGGPTAPFMEQKYLRLDGSAVDVEVSAVPFRHGDEDGALVIVRDLSEHKRSEKDRSLTLEILRLVNTCADEHELMRAVTLRLRDWSGCEAVGVRLRQQEDFPYFETQGFPPEFVALENSLCGRDPAGNPALECMCGNVLCGRFDPAKPFFSSKGSFWTNCTTELLAGTTEADRQGPTRNRCNGQGYESVALVALRAGGAVHGLLQFNDKRKGRFTAQSIAMLETIADHLAVAVAHRLAQAELQRREAALAEAQAQANIGNWRVSFRDGRQEWNGSDELLRIYGQPPGTPLTMQVVLERVHPDDQPRVAEQWSAALRGEGPKEWEFRILVKGRLKWLHLLTHFRRDAAGQPMEAYGTNQDITERKLAELKISRLSCALEQSPVLVVMTDLKGDIEYVNPRFCEVTGYAPAEVLGRNPRLLKSGETPAEEYRKLWEAIASGGEWRVEFHNKKKDGSLYWERAAISSLRDNSGERIGYLAVKVDITSEKSLESKLFQAQKMESVGRLAGGVAHDFNNLLTAINGYAQFVMEGLPPGDPKRDDVKEILAAGERAAALTRQLLAFSRKQILNPVALDLNAAVGGTLKMLKRLIGEDIRIDPQLAPRPCLVKVDAGQIDQILMNLAVNARDAMPDGGVLTVETAVEELSEDWHRERPWLPSGPLVRLRVTDTGTGMDEEVKTHLFEPFFTTKERGKGTGLGLSTVYGIVRQSGGEIVVASAPGQGSCFSIYLPQLNAGAPETALGAVATKSVGSETVLLVEDEETVRRLGLKVLTRCGYKVLAAADGRTALKLLEEHGPGVDLLITDVVMPGMNGRELAKAAAKLCPEMRTLYMSGYTDNAIVHHGVLEPGLAFLYKPFTAQALALKVRTVLDASPDQARP